MRVDGGAPTDAVGRGQLLRAAASLPSSAWRSAAAFAIVSSDTTTHASCIHEGLLRMRSSAEPHPALHPTCSASSLWLVRHAGPMLSTMLNHDSTVDKEFVTLPLIGAPEGHSNGC